MPPDADALWIVWLSVTPLWHIGYMRSQVITIMAPKDEAGFLGFVFERPHRLPDTRRAEPDA